MIVLDLLKDPALLDKCHNSIQHEHTVAHKGGFDREEFEKVFLNIGVLEDVKVEVSFAFNKFIEKDQKEYTFQYIMAQGKKKE